MPPGQEMSMPVKMAKSRCAGSGSGIVGPTGKGGLIDKGLLTAGGVVDLNAPVLSMRVLNPFDETIVVSQGTTSGMVYSIRSEEIVEQREAGDRSDTANEAEVPDFLKSLLDESSKHLTGLLLCTCFCGRGLSLRLRLYFGAAFLRPVLQGGAVIFCSI